MYCKRCGAKLDDDSKFCKECGLPVIDKDHEDAAFEEKQNNKKSSTVGLFIMAAILVILMIAVIFFVSGRGPEKNQPPAVKQTITETQMVQTKTQSTEEIVETQDNHIRSYSFSRIEWANMQAVASWLITSLGEEQLSDYEPYVTDQMDLNALGTYAVIYLSNDGLRHEDFLRNTDFEENETAGGYIAYDQEELYDLIYSSFGIETQGQLTYTYTMDDEEVSFLSCKDGVYYWPLADGAPYYCVRPYNIYAVGDVITTDVEYICMSNVGTFTRGFYHINWEVSDGSLYGYIMKSIQQIEKKDLKINNIEVTSSDNADRSIVNNLIDENTSTSWTGKSDAQMMIEFDSEQLLHGLNLANGSWESEEAYEFYGRPTAFRLEFSDGTSMDITMEDYTREANAGMFPFGCGNNNPAVGYDHSKWDFAQMYLDFISFGREIRTSYIKMTILDVAQGTGDGQISISEIRPY